MDLQCPECGNRVPGQFMGYEDPMVYDGVLIWRCIECGHAWPRVFGIASRDAAAKKWADSLNGGSDVA